MKKWNLLFLVLFIIFSILAIIPVFQNAYITVPMVFYWNKAAAVTWVYIKILILWMIDGILLLLYIQSLLKDVKRQDATKFDLNK